MDYIANSIVFLYVLFLGFSFSQIIKPFAFYKSKKGKSNFRFTFFCLSFIPFIILYTVAIFLTKSLYPHVYCAHLHVSHGFSPLSFYISISLIFLWGMLLSFFWKVVLPLSLLVYASIYVFTINLLEKNFEVQEKMLPVKFTEDKIIINDNHICRKDDKNAEIKFYFYTLPETIFLPVPRVWYDIEYTFEKESHLEKVENRQMKNPLLNSYLNKYLLSGNQKLVEVSLPEEKVFPALYSIHINCKEGIGSCSLVKDL